MYIHALKNKAKKDIWETELQFRKQSKVYLLLFAVYFFIYLHIETDICIIFQKNS